MKNLLLFAAAVFLSPLQSLAQEQVREFAPPVIREKGQWAASTYYDHGAVEMAAGIKGHWNVWVNTATYALNDLLTPYVSATILDYFHDVDYAGNAGTYLKSGDRAYLRTEIGWGGDIDYIYRSSAKLEYQHRLSGPLFWQVGARYFDFTEKDAYTVYPGLIRYFGEKSYVTAFYHRFFTENRGHGQWCTFQGHFALTRMLLPWLGAAAGQRIYNIGDLPASKQHAVVYFAGIDVNVSRTATVKAGYSYSRQKPHFTKRSIEAGVIVRF